MHNRLEDLNPGPGEYLWDLGNQLLDSSFEKEFPRVSLVEPLAHQEGLESGPPEDRSFVSELEGGDRYRLVEEIPHMMGLHPELLGGCVWKFGVPDNLFPIDSGLNRHRECPSRMLEDPGVHDLPDFGNSCIGRHLEKGVLDVVLKLGDPYSLDDLDIP